MRETGPNLGGLSYQHLQRPWVFDDEAWVDHLPPGVFKIETTEISRAQNSSFEPQIMPCHFLKKHNTSVFLKLFVHFLKIISVKPYGKTL